MRSRVFTKFVRVLPTKRLFHTDSSIKLRSVAAQENLEQIYQRKSPIEHVLLRPGMYVGSTSKVKSSEYIFEERRSRMVYKEDYRYIPGLVKIFDEIIVNAADNVQRCSKTTEISVTIDPKLGISVRNNGSGVPVVVHSKEQMYIPELVFGHLLTGSNFDDETARLTGGRHGYGAKLTNILSKEFCVETVDMKSKLMFKQTWKDHMNPVGEPQITAVNPENIESYTTIKFIPDFDLFGINQIDPGSMQLMKKRVVDIAGILGKNVSVSLNGKQIRCSSFKDYVGFYLKDSEQNDYKLAYNSQNRWEVAVQVIPQGGFSQVSFVNRMYTPQGGTHVQHVVDRITDYVCDFMNRKLPSDLGKVTAAQVKMHLSVFINCQIENPNFDSQMKEKLTSEENDFGSECNLSKSFFNRLLVEGGLEQAIVDYMRQKEQRSLSKAIRKNAKSRLHNIVKLEDANLAGSKHSSECTLILTEGDSAKALAVAGLSVLGRDKYGVFPLRGKLLNVREATKKQIANNPEITNICAILGLDFNKTYSSDTHVQLPLRYGRVLIMADQDYDGSHIKGLLLNMFHYFWPNLVKRPGFLCEFITPVVKARKGNEGRDFFSLTDFKSWWNNEGSKRGFKIKYYKGLGTNTSEEGRAYFSNLDRHLVEFTWGQGDDESDLIDMAFSKKRAADRKEWITKSYEMGEQMDFTSDKVSIDDFINKELVLFSQHDVSRSIPSVVDGLKPSQRKVLYAAFKKRLDSEMKVAQLAGYCSENTAYHHGENSLYSTIINMAQNFVGSNNLPLFYPSGQFGTRLLGGRDSASPRYIFTYLQPYTRSIFPEADDELLEYLEDDGMQVEPKMYVPIIPMVLVNGAEGIGTGWSTKVYQHNPLDIIACLKAILKGEKPKSLLPWFRGFDGNIEERMTGVHVTIGRYVVENEKTLRILELPIGRWTESFKEHLNCMIDTEEIKSYKEYHTESKVNFLISTTPQQMEILRNGCIIKKLKLQSTLYTGNAHLFDPSGTIKKYEGPEEILRDFYFTRLDLYKRRKSAQQLSLWRKLMQLKNEVNFSKRVCSGEITMMGKSKVDLVNELDVLGFDRYNTFIEESLHVKAESEFDYLLRKSLIDMTTEKISSTLEIAEKIRSNYDKVVSSSPEELWLGDLEELETKLNVELH